jgi:hypothetical protein
MENIVERNMKFEKEYKDTKYLNGFHIRLKDCEGL